MNINTRLRTFRAKNELSQSEMAALIPGARGSYVSQWEAGKWRVGKASKWNEIIGTALNDLESKSTPSKPSAVRLNGEARPMLRQALDMALKHGDIPADVRKYCQAVLDLECAGS